MHSRIMLLGVLVSAGLVVPAKARAGEPGAQVQAQIHALVEEFKAEQAGADAALAREFADEAGRRVNAALGEARTRAATDVARLGEDVGALIQERFGGGTPAWDKAANQRLSAQIVELVAKTRTALDAIGPEVRTQLTNDLGALGRQYVARRNGEMGARVMRYVGRAKALIAQATQVAHAQVKQAIDRAVAEFRAKIQAGIKPPGGAPRSATGAQGPVGPRWPAGAKGPTIPRAAPAVHAPVIRRR